MLSSWANLVHQIHMIERKNPEIFISIKSGILLWNHQSSAVLQQRLNWPKTKMDFYYHSKVWNLFEKLQRTNGQADIWTNRQIGKWTNKRCISGQKSLKINHLWSFVATLEGIYFTCIQEDDFWLHYKFNICRNIIKFMYVSLSTYFAFNCV